MKLNWVQFLTICISCMTIGMNIVIIFLERRR